MDIICLSLIPVPEPAAEKTSYKKHIKNVTLFIMPDPVSPFCYTRDVSLKEHAFFSSLIKTVWPQDVLVLHYHQKVSEENIVLSRS